MTLLDDLDAFLCVDGCRLPQGRARVGEWALCSRVPHPPAFMSLTLRD
jgi:hypothetical protein